MPGDSIDTKIGRERLEGIIIGIGIAAIFLLASQGFKELRITGRFLGVRGTSGTQGSRFEGNLTSTSFETIDISRYSISPPRVEIGEDESVRFLNRNDFPVYVEFERKKKNITIEAGGELRLRFGGNYIIYRKDTREKLSVGEIYVR